MKFKVLGNACASRLQSSLYVLQRILNKKYKSTSHVMHKFDGCFLLVFKFVNLSQHGCRSLLGF
uniref:Uncharacterized protein n=1 Tax=Rhizophora mucronata TaxID=61149 RepID=A0A2P2JAP4_RHIMU